MIKKIKSAAAAVISAAVLLTGCSEDINAKPVASMENPPEGAGEHFTISYKEWHSEYLYRISVSGYTEEDNAEICAQFRDDVIQYLTQERIVLYLAEQMGITAASLTEDEIKTIEENVQNNLKSWYDSFETDAKLALGSGYTDDELLKKEQELFEEFLSGTGITVDDYTLWETNELIRQKYIAAVGESIDDQTVEDFVQSAVDDAKKMYEEDIATYEQSYTAFYIPEGSRVVQQLVILIDDISASEVKAYRNEGDDEKADEILNAALEKVRFRIEEAYEKLQQGEDWTTVQEEYNDEPSTNGVDYNLYPKSSTIDEKIINAAIGIESKGGYSEIQITDAGYSIIYYKDDLVFTDEMMQSLIEQGREYLTQQEAYQRILDFLEEHPYVLDYELMDLEENVV